jgi:hypothetical protein
MRIYDGDFTVGRLIEQCATAPRRASNLPLPGREAAQEIDIISLNRCLADLPIAEIRRRRRRMNTFYEEVLVSSDPDRGIQFTSLLMILAHHKVINDNKSLRYVLPNYLLYTRLNMRIDWKSFSVVALASNVSKRLCVAMSLSVSSIRSIGPGASAVLWIRRNRVVWLLSPNSPFPRFSSTTKTLLTHSAFPITHRVVAHSSHLPIQTHKAVLSVSHHHHALIQMQELQEGEQARSNKHLQDRQHGRHQARVHSHHLETASGSLLARSVDRQARLRSWILGRRIVAAEQIVQSVRPMFWKYLTTLHGARVYAGASRSGEGVEY